MVDVLDKRKGMDIKAFEKGVTVLFADNRKFEVDIGNPLDPGKIVISLMNPPFQLNQKELVQFVKSYFGLEGDQYVLKSANYGNGKKNKYKVIFYDKSERKRMITETESGEVLALQSWW